MKTKHLLILFLFSSLTAIGQNYDNIKFENLNNTNGLPSDEIYCTAQDKNGFIWFCTGEGIVRYDGYEFKTFKNHPYLGKMYGLVINHMYIDSKGNYYVCTNEGFFAFNIFLEPILENVTSYFQGRKLNYVIKASDETIYISSVKGFYIIEPGSQKITELLVNTDCGLTNNDTKQIIEDQNGQIWVTSWSNQLLCLNEDKRSFTDYELFDSNFKPGIDVALNALFIDSRGYLWVGSWEKGLFVLDINTKGTITLIKEFIHQPDDSNSIPGDIIYSIAEDPYNAIWIGTPYGLSVIQHPLSNNHKITNYKPNDDANGINNAVVTHVFKDNANILWISTKGGGIFKHNVEKKQFENIKIPNLSPQKRNQAVHSFQIDHKGRLLAGVLSIGFVVYDLDNKTFKHYTDVPEYKILDKYINLNTVYTFHLDQDSVLWLGTRYNGLLLLDLKTQKVDIVKKRINWQNYRGREITVIKELPNGSVLVGSNDGLNLMSRGVNGIWQSKHIDLLQSDETNEYNSFITGIIPLDYSTIIVSSEKNGLFKLKLNKGNVTIEKWTQIKDKIVSIFLDNMDRIWIGTKGQGLKYINKNDTIVHSLNPHIKIMGDIIYGINQDNNNNIWVTTNNGLVKINTNQPNFFTENYFYRDGLQGNIFLPRSFYCDKKGLFYIGGYNGFNTFDPNKIKSNQISSPVAITEIQVEGETIDVASLKDSTIYLNHLKNDFSIKFTSLCYLYPAANQYAYQMKGLDKGWRYVNSEMRSANYNNMPPGEYTFMIKGSNSQGFWNEKPLMLKIVVKIAPYKTWWAISIYMIMIILLATFFLKQRIKIERIKQKVELEHLARIKSDKLNQYKLSFFTNISHELLTPIAILSSSLFNLKQHKNESGPIISVMERNVTNLDRLIKQLLTFRKIETNSMKVVIKDYNISDIVNSCAQDFKPLAEKKGIDLILEIQEKITGKIDKEKWELILRNLLSNAIKYTTSGNVKIIFAINDQSKATIKITDTGCGISEESIPKIFNRFYRISEDEEQTQGIGIGLHLTKSLVQILNGSINVQSKLGTGTTFSLILPIDGSHSDTFKEEPLQSEGDNNNYNLKQQSLTKEPFLLDTVSNNETFRNKAILLVEDNDDFRDTLKTTLKPFCKIYEAKDGLTAMEIAEKEDIDVIISDIMMPNQSGYELCHNIKVNIKTSHIPVILLTAMVGDENKLLGYRAGANAYIEKPVNMKLLLAQIQSLLNNMETFRRQTGVNLSLEPENVSITPLDEEFFNKAKKIVEKNISDSEFSIKDFANDLCVSNSMLYRKIKSLTDSSPSEFIRNIRLKRSAQLLQNKAFTISEVAYKCGFNDLGYFGVCFKKMFGETPTSYQTNNQKTDIKNH